MFDGFPMDFLDLSHLMGFQLRSMRGQRQGQELEEIVVVDMRLPWLLFRKKNIVK
jgi:hypothetical protein